MPERIILRDAAPLSAEPREYLTEWRIVTLANGDRHFSGYRANGTTVRVSSKIVLFDADGKTGMTQSGRIYQLEGPPGNRHTMQVAIAVWCLNNGIDPADVALQDE